MDVNDIMSQYSNVNDHIDELNKIAETGYQGLLETAQSEGQTAGFFRKAKATADVATGISGAAKSALDAGKVAKTGQNLAETALSVAKTSKVGQAIAQTGKAGQALVQSSSDVADLTKGGRFLAGASKLGGSAIELASKAGSVVGAAEGAWDLGKNIYEDIRDKNVHISGDNWQEKTSTVLGEIGGALDGASLVAGPEMLVAGALFQGVGEVMNIWGGSKDNNDVPEPPPPVLSTDVQPPSFATLGMVQNHNNNIKQFLT